MRLVMFMNMQLISTFKTMTSREIADLAGKRHAAVLRDIRAMVERLKADPEIDVNQHFQVETYMDKDNKPRPMYCLDKGLVLTLISAYNTVARFKVFAKLEIANLRDLLSDFDASDLRNDQFVYVAMERISRRYKVGISKDPEQRVRALSGMNPEGLILLAVYKAKHGRLSETIAHQHLSKWRLNGEWFSSEAPVSRLLEVIQ